MLKYQNYKELADIDDRLTEINPELKHGDERSKAHDEIKTLNARKHVISSQLSGTGRQIGTRNDGSPVTDQGLQGQLNDLTMIAMQHQAEAERYIALADHAELWSWEEKAA